MECYHSTESLRYFLINFVSCDLSLLKRIRIYCYQYITLTAANRLIGFAASNTLLSGPIFVVMILK